MPLAFGAALATALFRMVVTSPRKSRNSVSVFPCMEIHGTWNSLPEHLWTSDPTLNSFKCSLKRTCMYTNDTLSALGTLVIVGYIS